MTPKAAKKRYFATSMGSALGYLGAVFGISFIHRKLVDGSALAILVAAIPAVFLCLMIWGLWRYLDDMDEVERHFMTQAMIGALAIILAFCGGWGLVEMLNESLPPLPVFYIFPAYFLTFGLISAVKYRRCV